MIFTMLVVEVVVGKDEGEGNINVCLFVAFYFTAHDRKLRKLPREFFKL
jgi:hypothetical protein